MNPAPLKPLLGRREGWWMPCVFPVAIFPCAVRARLCSASSYLPVNASVVKIACQTTRQGAQKCTGDQPEDMKMERCFNPAAFCRRSLSNGNASSSVLASISLHLTNPLLPREVRGCWHRWRKGRRQLPALHSQQHCAPLYRLSAPWGESAVGFAVRKSANETLQHLSTNLISGSGEPGNMMLALAGTGCSRAPQIS